MNQLEALELIEEAKKYIGKEVILRPFHPTEFKRMNIKCRYDGQYAILESSLGTGDVKEKINIQVTAKMIVLDGQMEYLPYQLQSVIEAYKQQEEGYTGRKPKPL